MGVYSVQVRGGQGGTSYRYLGICRAMRGHAGRGGRRAGGVREAIIRFGTYNIQNSRNG